MDNSVDSVHKEWATPVPAGVVLIGAGLALAAAAAASQSDPAAMVFIAIGAVGLFAAGVIALVRRPRLALVAGPALRIRTLTGTDEYRLDEIERVSMLQTRRLAARSSQMLIDLPDDRLAVFSRWDLGENPAIVAAELHEAGFPSDQDRRPPSADDAD